MVTKKFLSLNKDSEEFSTVFGRCFQAIKFLKITNLKLRYKKNL